MALTSTTTFDIVGHTQTLTFNNPGEVDKISYANGQITFASESSFNLAKSDVFLYNKYLQAFTNLLLINFPSISSSIGQIWPICIFDITISYAGVMHIIYNQQTAGTTVMNINYVSIANSAGFAARGAPVTISIQELFMFVFMMNQYAQQVNLN